MPDPKPTPEPKKPDIPKTPPAAEPEKPDSPVRAADPKPAPTTGEKKPDLPAKTTDPKAAPAADEKKPEPPVKATDPKAAPAAGEKKPEPPAKTTDPKAAPTAGEKKPDTPAKTADPKTVPTAGEKMPEPPAKATDPKAAPTAGEKKPEPPAKTTDPKSAPTAGEKKPGTPAKTADPKAAPTAGEKKPEPPAKATDPKAVSAAGEKKPEPPAKATDPKPAPTPGEKKPDTPAKAADSKAAPAAGEKKPEPPAKADAPKTAPAAEPKKPDAPAKGPDLKIVPPSAEKSKDATVTDPKPKEAAVSPKGVRITQILADRLEKPSEEDLKKIPQPKEGEGISMQLHPAYFFQFLDHPFTVNRETQDYKELFDSIRENGINEPIKARPREGGGLELISGHRRHDVAMQLNYPVPVVIVQMDDDSAKIEVVDGNLHRQDIPTSELARAAKMKMEALSRKAGRRSKMEQLTNGPQKRTDQIVAEDMGMSRNQVQRLVRIDALIPGLKQQVDDKKLPFNTAVELSYLTPAEQHSVAEYIKSEQTVPSLSQAQELKAKSQEAAKAAKATPAPGAKQSHNYTSSIPPTQQAAAPVPTAAPAPPEKKAPAPVTEKTIASIMKPKKEPEIKVTFTGDELRSYFGGKQPTVPEAKLAIFDALNMRKKAMEKQAQKPDKTPKAPTR